MNEITRTYLGKWKGEIDTGERRIQITLEFVAREGQVHGVFHHPSGKTSPLQLLALSATDFRAVIESIPDSYLQGLEISPERIAGDYYEDAHFRFEVERVSGDRDGVRR